MEDLVQRLEKYVSRTSLSAKEQTISTTIELPRETAGILLWNLIVRYTLDSDDATVSDGAIITGSPDEDGNRNGPQHKAGLYIVVEEFIVANDSYNRQEPCLGITENLLTMANSIVRAALENAESCIKCPKSLKILARIRLGVPEMLRTAQAEMESEAFIESMLAPMAATLVPDTRTVSERVLGFKIWDFVSQYSQSAVRNHGIYFGPIIFNFCCRYHKICRRYPEPEETAEQIADLHEIFDQILSCIETHAVTERLDSFMNTTGPTDKYTSYFQAFDWETFGKGRCSVGFGFPHPFNYKMLMVVFQMNRYQKRGGLHKITEILWRMNSQILTPTRQSYYEINPDIFEYLLNGVFTTVFSAVVEEKPEIHEKSQLVGKIVSWLAQVCSQYTRFVRDEATQASLLHKLRKLDDLAKMHCCPSCYPAYCNEYYFIKYVLHQKDAAPFQFYRQHRAELYKICYENDPNNDNGDFEGPKKCQKIHGELWV